MTVCILAAGRGSRLGSITDWTHKGLAPVAYRSVLSRVITSFPAGTRFVVAVGYRADLLREYIAIAHPSLDVTFVDVENFDKPGSGPGLSLLACRDELGGAFVFTTCDTLVDEPIPAPAENWIGVAPHEHIERFCSAGADDRGFVTRIDYRLPVEGNRVFIGIGGVADTEAFWSALEGNRELVHGEHQIANGLAGLVPLGLKAVPFTWHDTGDEEGFRAANSHFRGEFANFDKANEFIYFEDGAVVKFFADADITRRRVDRNRILGDACPAVTASTTHFYRYPFIEGSILAQGVDDVVFRRFLDWCREHVWHPRDLSEGERATFRQQCLSFYLDKTRSRLKQFKSKTGIADVKSTINGYEVDSAEAMLERIDWTLLSDGIPTGFHGDLHFDNTLVPSDPAAGPFKLLDWRHDFCGIIEYGDWYYDLAKIHHELIISHDEIKANQFSVERQGDGARILHLVRSEYVGCQKVLARFVEEQGMDYQRVLLLTYLIFLNMSPLHHEPFDQFLYSLGRLGLHQVLAEGYDRA